MEQNLLNVLKINLPTIHLEGLRMLLQIFLSSNNNKKEKKTQSTYAKDQRPWQAMSTLITYKYAHPRCLQRLFAILEEKRTVAPSQLQTSNLG